MKRKLLIVLVLVTTVFLVSCGKKPPKHPDRVVVGIPEDVESFNPLYTLSVDAANIGDLLYLSLVEFNWNSKEGSLVPVPMLAKKWEWNKDSTSLTFYLRNDVEWTDGVKFTSDDVVFSFDVYSDPDVQSRLYGTFKNLFVDGKDHIDIKKTFDVESPYEFTIHFLPKSNPKLYDVVFPIIPRHIFSKIERKNIPTADANFHPVSDGPFVLDKWNKNQNIILKSNPKSFLYNTNNIPELVFKIIPDYNGRLTQLEKGEIDLMELIRPDDLPDLKRYSDIKIASVKGREYDYVGWNNIDPAVYKKNKKFVPNKFFGDAKVRVALTYAINRNEILENYMLNNGTIASGPVSPIFKGVLDSTISPYKYDVGQAKKLLAEDGWKDTDNNGIIDKNGVDFSFKLYIPSGNPLRSYTATVVKNNLKEVGIDAEIETIELGTFIDNLYNRSMNAWIVAWYIPIPLELKTYWYSDISTTPLNFVSYKNNRVDQLLDYMEKKQTKDELKKIYFEFQKIIHRDEPVTFLYWKDDITGYNKAIRNIEINPLGVVHYCWNWSVKNNE